LTLIKDAAKLVNFSRIHSSTRATVERLQHGLDVAIALCLGLIPSFHLLALQLAMVFVLISALLRGRQIFTNLPHFGWPHVMLLQFILYFLLNTWLYPSLEGNLPHLRRVAFESYGMTLLGFAVIWVYLGRGHDVMASFQSWAPVGLFLSFCVMSYFVFGPQGTRARAFSTNALVPPMWYLVLTLICFCDFNAMAYRVKLMRIALLGTAAVMCLYSGGRMILLIWLLCTIILAAHVLRSQRQGTSSFKDIALVFGALVVGLFVLYVFDAVSGWTLAIRFAYTFEKLWENGLTSETFYRIEIWSAALEVIKQSLPFGSGHVNERLLIHGIITRDWWFAAHQTYLSYLIAGGWIALASGIIFQCAGCQLFHRGTLPAALGIVLVPALNGLTDSVFQSFFAVQLYMLLLLFILHGQNRGVPAVPEPSA
jgi:hypothetical protein